MPEPIFITGIGTGVGKTFISAIITQALHADYWKPIQAGFTEGTDSELVKTLLQSRKYNNIFPEAYKLSLAASPHIAAREENIQVSIDHIISNYKNIQQESQADYLIIEGAGGLMVPINEKEFVLDLIDRLDAYVIIVSRNYLGSINHSLLTAQACRQKNLKVLGWIFNDQYMDYQLEIVDWSGYPVLYSVPSLEVISEAEVLHHSELMKSNLLDRLNTFAGNGPSTLTTNLS